MLDVVLPLVVIGVIGTLACYAIAARLEPSERAWVLRVLLAAFAIRLAVATVFALVRSVRLFHEDADGYEVIGMMLANRWHNAGPPVLLADVSNLGHFYVCGALYYVFGTFRPVPSYVNALLGTLTIWFVYRMALRQFHVVVARRAALLVALMPSVVLWNSLALKDTEVTLLVVIALASCIRLKRRFSTSAFLGTVVPVLLLQPIRFYMIYFLGLAIIGSLVFDHHQECDGLA